MRAIIAGVNFSLFTYGASESGKSYTIEGNKSDVGLAILLIGDLFNILE
jgi:hypothetical protein